MGLSLTNRSKRHLNKDVTLPGTPFIRQLVFPMRRQAKAYFNIQNYENLTFLSGIMVRLVNSARYESEEARYRVKVKKGDIIGSLCCKTKNGIPVKIVFVSNRNKKSEWRAIISTDLSLDDKEIVRIYGMRWGIEVFFKASKSLLKLGTEYQAGAMICSSPTRR